MASTLKQSPETNNINLLQLLELVEHVKGDPTLADFHFRTNNKWQSGTHSEATVQHYYGASQEHDDRPDFQFEIDEPPTLLGRDHGANPVEYLLIGLSACMTTAVVVEAAAQGITLKSVESTVEGHLDLQGFLGLSAVVPVGYKEINVEIQIEANIDEKKNRS